jgi:hypothetical protein
LFNAFIELGASSPAIAILNKMMTLPSHQIEKMFSKSTVISDSAKEKIFRFLFELVGDFRNNKSKKEFECSDLVLALFCFSQDDKNSEYYRLLVLLESTAIPLISKLSPVVVCGLLYSYATVGRVFPPIFIEFDKIILGTTNYMGCNQICNLLWVYAKLNYTENSVTQNVLVDNYINYSSVRKSLSKSGCTVSLFKFYFKFLFFISRF